MAPLAATVHEAADAAEEDDAGETAQEEGWSWVYDDEAVRQDQEEAALRADKTRKEWDTTAKNASSIRGHIARLYDDRPLIPEDPAAAALADPAAPPGSRGSRSPGGGPGGAAASAAAEGNVDHQRNCLVAAEKMNRTQEKWHNVSANLGIHKEEHKNKRDRIAEAMVASDARVLEQQNELIGAQRRRAFNNAQRRSEQQKTLRDMRREKDRLYEAYYTKNFAATSPQQAQEREQKQLARGQSAPVLGSLAGGRSDDIFRSMHSSHGRYVEQLDQWRAFVNENERRTEAQWKKILQGASKEEVLGDIVSPMDKLKKHAKAIQNKAGITNMLRSLTKEAADKREVERAAQQAMSLAETSIETAEVPESPTFWRSEISPNGSIGSSFTQKWSTLQKRCTLHFEELEEGNRRKLQRQETTMSEARQRIAQHNNGIVERYKEASRLWQERNDAAATRRRELAVSTDEHLVQKQKDWSRKWAVEQAQRADGRRSRTAAREAQTSKFQANNASFHQAKVDSALTNLEKLDAAATEKAVLRATEHQNRIERDNYAEVVAEAQERRNKAERAVVIKTKKEIAAKNERSNRALEKLRYTIIDKEREVRKERSRSGSGSTTAFAGPLSLPLISEPVPMSPLRPPPRRQSSDSGVFTPPEESEESSAQGEQEFLEELEQRSGEWLQDLRRHKRTVVA